MPTDKLLVPINITNENQIFVVVEEIDDDIKVDNAASLCAIRYKTCCV
jgi:hypothetical protein